MSSQLFKKEFLKRMLGLAKSQPLSFAFAATEEGSTLILHDKLAPKDLWQKLKAETKAKSTEGTFGAARMEGSAMVLSPERKLAGLKRSFLDLCAEAKLKVAKVRFADEPEGQPDADGAPPAVSPEEAEIDNILAPLPPPPPPTPQQAATIKATDRALKATEAWRLARAKTQAEMGALQAAILGLGDLDNNAVIRLVDQFFSELPNPEEDLARLASATASGDSAAAETARKQALAALGAAREHLAGPVGRMIASNPLVPVGLDSRLGAALQVLEKSLN